MGRLQTWSCWHTHLRRSGLQLSQLRAERDKLERALVREVGSDVPMAKLLADEGGDWRGRAQQIGLLRDKVRELQESQVQRAAVPRVLVPWISEASAPSTSLSRQNKLSAEIGGGCSSEAVLLRSTTPTSTACCDW